MAKKGDLLFFSGFKKQDAVVKDIDSICSLLQMTTGLGPSVSA